VREDLDMFLTSNRVLRTGVAILLGLGAFLLAPTEARAADTEAWQTYQEFVAACHTATSMEELLPFLPKWRKERHAGSDEESRKGTLQRICKDANELQDMAFVDEKNKGKETVLQLTASWEGSPMKGEVTVVREKNGLKIEEWLWVTGS